MAEWEVEIKIRRNGRLVNRDSSGICDNPSFALYWAHQDLSCWADEHPESTSVDGSAQ